MRETLRPVAAGMCVGALIAAGAVQLLHRVLFGVSPFDPIAFTAAPLLVLAIAAAAASVPTRRATRVSPMAVLRAE